MKRRFARRIAEFALLVLVLEALSVYGARNWRDAARLPRTLAATLLRLR